MNAQTSKEGATQDAPRDAASASFDPTYTSANSEVRAAAGGYSVTLNEGDGALKVGTEHKRAASSLASQFQGTSLNMAGSPTPDGGRDYLLTMESVVGASAKGAGFQDTSSTGVRGRYRVSLPSEAVDVDPTRINPFDPQTIPKGGSVTLDGQQFTGTALEGSFRNIAMQSQTTEASGASYRVDRLDDGRVRVTTGPNEAVEAFNGMGFSAGRFSAIAGRQDALGHAAVRTATFDLDQAEGRQAYEQFIDNGTLSGQTPGVQDLATVERLGMSSQARLKVGYGDTFGLDLAGARNSGDVVQVSREDGSRTELRSVQYNGNLPATRVSAYGADGQEDRAQRRYEFTFDLRGHAQGEQIAGMANAALSGDPSGDRGPVKAGELTTLSFSEAQMRTLMERTQSMVGDNPMLGPSWQVLAEDGNGRPQQDVDAFALGLARNQGQSTYGMAERLFHIAAAGGKDLQKIDAAVQGDHLQSLAPPSPLLPRQDPRHTVSPDHGMWLQSQGAVSSLDQAMGRQPDEMSERLGMALLVAAKAKGMQRIDEAVLSDDGRYAFAVQGQPHAADRQIARTDTAQAVATPVSEHVRELQQGQSLAASSEQASQQQEREQLSQEHAARAMAR
ncbi:hypothetical protein OHC51_13500 [Stenotrophomonas indicatrix]|uniref:XVIPCD domain-containing protein n=1 Tax=Stenotrophomonas indicatrix TaxID=2045451 RepID=UPI00300ABC8B